MTEAAQLSCEQCKQRKTKCDKGAPCSACRAGGLTCQPVQRARLPRGRVKNASKKKKTITLQDKVARLEQLVTTLEAQVQSSESVSTDSVPSSISSAPNSRHAYKLENLTARDFWISLSNEVSGLRETLEESDEDDVENDLQDLLHASSLELRPTSLATTHGVLFSHVQDNIQLPHLSDEQKLLLLEIYQSRADWIVKVLHWPSTFDLLRRNHGLENGMTSSAANMALEYSIYFLTFCTLLDHEFIDYKLGDQTLLLQVFQKATETLLSRANLLTTTNITVLQAFVLYITAIRCSVNAASAWTLVAIAVRIAHACDLNNDRPGVYSAFETEMRRRLWYSIGFLDSQTSFGRGTAPLIPWKDLKYPPQVINDSQMSPENGILSTETHGFTDMSFSNLSHRAMACQRRLIDPNLGSWQARLDVVNAFERSLSENFSHLESCNSIKEVFTLYASRTMPVTLQLLLRRPLYKDFGDAVPPIDDNYDVLKIGCTVLQAGLTKVKNSTFATLFWFKWPKWFALAVVLVELCAQPPDALFDESFAIAQESYDDYAQSAADVCSGELWKPIAKLMRRVEKLRQHRQQQQQQPQQHDMMSPIDIDAGDLWVQWDTFLEDIDGSNFNDEIFQQSFQTNHLNLLQ